MMDYVPAVVMTPRPGERCPTCDLRQPKPRQRNSPPIKKVIATGPPEHVDAVSEALDALQAYVGADSLAYPRLKVLEALAILGGQQREELRRYFEERVKA